MSKTVFSTVIIALAGMTLSAAVPSPSTNPVPKKWSELTPEEKEARRAANVLQDMISCGGTCEVPGSLKGSIRIVNAQKRVADTDLSKLMKEFAQRLNYDFKVIDGDAATPKNAVSLRQKIGANLAVFLVDDPGAAILLTAPEDRWAIVNVAKLATDNPKPAFLAARTRKEVFRAIGFITAASPYASRMMSAINSPADLDEIARERYPVDVEMRMRKYLGEIGVKAQEWETYRNLIAGGYEIAPTNRYQKAIYDEEKAKRAKTSNK